MGRQDSARMTALLAEGVSGEGSVAEDRHNSPWTHPNEALPASSTVCACFDFHVTALLTCGPLRTAEFSKDWKVPPAFFQRLENPME